MKFSVELGTCKIIFIISLQLPLTADFKKSFYRTFSPINSYTSGASVINFILPRMTNTQVYVLQKLALLMSVRIVDKDGNPPPKKSSTDQTWPKIAPANDLINS